MRWIAVLALLLFLTGTSRAAAPDDQYLDIYNEILQGDNLQQNAHAKEATAKYTEAQTALKKLQQEQPAWNAAVVSFRLDYLAEQLQALQKAAPATHAPATNATTTTAAAPAKAVTEADRLREQVRSLTAANAELANKLKEALSVQPAAVSPRELAKAEEKNIALEKEKDLLTVALEQAKTAKLPSGQPAAADKTARQLADANQALADLKAHSSLESKATQAEMERLKDSLADAQKQIAANTAEMKALKSSYSAEGSTEIAAERDKLKKELAARTRDLADAEAHRDPSISQLRTQLVEAERQRDELKTKLALAPAAAPATAISQADALRARLAVLEAQAVPYTAEELAVLKKSPFTVPAQMPAPPVEKKRIVHSIKDLPPGVGAMMAEAARDTMARDYGKAAEKYQEILHQDENNVYVLAHLANAQFAMNQLPECEKTVARALALDPEDPASLYLLGILRYRQEKLDEALDALSRSAKYNPTNSGTQYYLGRALVDKGLRAAAETAFRKVLSVDPEYADAHFSLAFVYAAEKPPALELARWHYRRALDLGHEKSEQLDKFLAPSP